MPLVSSVAGVFLLFAVVASQHEPLEQWLKDQLLNTLGFPNLSFVGQLLAACVYYYNRNVAILIYGIANSIDRVHHIDDLPAHLISFFGPAFEKVGQVGQYVIYGIIQRIQDYAENERIEIIGNLLFAFLHDVPPWMYAPVVMGFFALILLVGVGMTTVLCHTPRYIIRGTYRGILLGIILCHTPHYIVVSIYTGILLGIIFHIILG